MTLTTTSGTTDRCRAMGIFPVSLHELEDLFPCWSILWRPVATVRVLALEGRRSRHCDLNKTGTITLCRDLHRKTGTIA